MGWLSLPLVLFVAVLMLALPLSAQEKDEKKETEETEMMEMVEGEEESVVELVEIEPFYYCAMEMTGSYEQHSTAFMKLFNAVAMQGLPMDEAPFGVYWNSPTDTPEEELRWEIGLLVPDNKEIQEPLKKKKWGYTLLVTREFEGAFESEDMFAAYSEIFEWMEENGYVQSGPMLEKFLNMPTTNEEGEVIGKVQIVIPVQKTEEEE